MGYSSRKPHQMLLLSAKNRTFWLQCSCLHRNFTITGLSFQLQHADGRARTIILLNIRTCITSKVEATDAGVMVWRIFFCHTSGPLVPQRFHFLMTNSSAHITELIISVIYKKKWFLVHDNEFTVLKWPPGSPDLNLVDLL